MSYRLAIFNQRDDLQRILRTGMIHCEVVLCDRPSNAFRYVFCVHCRRFRAVSWERVHSKTNPFVLTPRLARLLLHSMYIFENDIRTEVELAWDAGKLFARRRSLWDNAVTTPPSLPFHSPITSSRDDVIHQVSSSLNNSSGRMGLDENRESDSHFIERTICCVEELVLEHCFTRKLFDCARFLN